MVVRWLSAALCWHQVLSEMPEPAVTHFLSCRSAATLADSTSLEQELWAFEIDPAQVGLTLFPPQSILYKR